MDVAFAAMEADHAVDAGMNAALATADAADGTMHAHVPAAADARAPKDAVAAAAESTLDSAFAEEEDDDDSFVNFTDDEDGDTMGDWVLDSAFDTAYQDGEALFAACSTGDLDTVDRILTAGAAVSPRAPEALITACRLGHDAIVEQLLEARVVSPNTRDSRDGFALVVASKAGHSDVVRVLIAAGANVDLPGDDALEAALAGNHVEVAKSLLEGGVNIHSSRGTELLPAACAQGLHAFAVQLLAAGADVNAGKDAALRAACNRRDCQLVTILLRAGADVHTGDDAMLNQACSGGQLELVRTLVDGGADVKAQRGNALRAACRGGHLEVVTLLLASSVPDQRNLDAALLAACEKRQLEIARVLVRAGADVNMGRGLLLKNASEAGITGMVTMLMELGADVHADGGDSLKLAALGGHLDIVEILIQALGPSVRRYCDGAFQAVCRAYGLRHNVTEVVARLVRAGADVRADNDRALRAAASAGSVNVAAQLLAEGADVHAGNDDPLFLAVRAQNIALVELLVGAGANVNAQNENRRTVLSTAFTSTVNVALIIHLVRAGADLEDIPQAAWRLYRRADWVRILFAVVPRRRNELATPQLWVWVRVVAPVRRSLLHALRRARARLDHPPTSTLGTGVPTRARLIAHLQTGGRRFAREYWTEEGLPLFFSDVDLGPLPDIFVAPVLM